MYSRNEPSEIQNTDNNSDNIYSKVDFSKLFGKNDESTILHKYTKSLNLVAELTEEQLNKISNNLISAIEEDKQTQATWLQQVEDAQRLAALVREPKNTPLPNSANIKFPLIRDACNQFAARTYPEIIQDGKIVKAEVIGRSNPMLEDLAQAISTHMSYQLLGPDSEWETGIDKLLVVLPLVGFVVKKTYYDSIKKYNCSDLCNYKDIILRNDCTVQCLSDLRRITHILHVHPNDLIENARANLYSKSCLEEILKTYEEKTNPDCALYECHCFLDLDQDDYEEPYIVTIHKETHKILRIIARYDNEGIEHEEGEIKRITPVQYFTDYHFLPSPDGCFMSNGFGLLMLHLNETINTLFNQLIDAGSLANMQTGFIDSRIKLPGGQLMADPGQWTKAKGVEGQLLKDGIVPVIYKEPSQVLFSLMQLLMQTGKDLSSSTDALQGSMNATNVPATSMLAMIEQGMKMFSAIQKRLYRSLKEEFKKIFRLNKLYLSVDDIIDVIGPDANVNPDIYKTKNIRIIPIADPNLASDAQRLAQAQVIMGLSQAPDSLIDKFEAQKRMLQAAKVSNIDLLLPPQKKQAQAAQEQKPDPKMLKVQADAAKHQGDLQIKSRAQDLKEKEFAAKLSKIEAEITQMQAHAVKLVSDADAVGKKISLQALGLQLDTVKSHIQALTAGHQQALDQDIAQKQMQIDQQKNQQGHLENMSAMALQQQQQTHDQMHDIVTSQSENSNEDGNNEGANSNMDTASSNTGTDKTAEGNEGI